MSDKDGGPAFPIPNATDMDGYVYAPDASGMSLRAYAAIQAGARMVASYGPKIAAKGGLEFADAMIAMLAEREGR